MTSRARLAWAVRVLVSRTARLREYAHTARHDVGCAWGSHTGSASMAGSLSRLRPALGVRVSMTCPSLKWSPCQRKCDSRSIGALVSRDPTMNLQPAVSSAARFAAESIPASATTAKFSMPCRARNWADDRQDCVLLGLVSLEAADLEREA